MMIYISEKDDIDWSGQFLRLPFSLIVASYIAWPPMRSHLNNERVQLTKEFTEKIGEDLGISGVQEVWEANKERKAFKLLV